MRFAERVIAPQFFALGVFLTMLMATPQEIPLLRAVAAFQVSSKLEKTKSALPATQSVPLALELQTPATLVIKLATLC